MPQPGPWTGLRHTTLAGDVRSCRSEGSLSAPAVRGVVAAEPEPRLDLAKSNAQQYGIRLWDDVFKRVAVVYPDIETESVLVDAMVAKFVLRPEDLDVVVASKPSPVHRWGCRSAKASARQIRWRHVRDSVACPEAAQRPYRSTCGRPKWRAARGAAPPRCNELGDLR